MNIESPRGTGIVCRAMAQAMVAVGGHTAGAAAAATHFAPAKCLATANSA